MDLTLRDRTSGVPSTVRLERCGLGEWAMASVSAGWDVVLSGLTRLAGILLDQLPRDNTREVVRSELESCVSLFDSGKGAHQIE